MRHFLFTFLILLFVPAILWAQTSPAPLEVDFDRVPPTTNYIQPPAPGDPDNLLTGLFSDAPQVNPSPPPAPPPTVNLPGTASPVSTPAASGEAVIERSDTTKAPVPSNTAPTGVTRSQWTPTTPAEHRYALARNSWIPKNQSSSGNCSNSYVATRPLYPVRCIATLHAVQAPNTNINPRQTQSSGPLDIRTFP
ncbi:MAG: hypothetical protein LBF22_04615 [Deltaproteobacteria bacterium]|nr:hypothetical protein [Deltaproteobacteria bacterium]